jgi:hypothetical protein
MSERFHPINDLREHAPPQRGPVTEVRRGNIVVGHLNFLVDPAARYVRLPLMTHSDSDPLNDAPLAYADMLLDLPMRWWRDLDTRREERFADASDVPDATLRLAAGFKPI